jgi:hypothetical protein
MLILLSSFIIGIIIFSVQFMSSREEMNCPTLYLFQNYLKAHPSIPVMDAMDKVLVLLNRNQVYKMVQDCRFDENG